MILQDNYMNASDSPRGGLSYKKGGDAHREISIEPLTGTNLGVA